MFALELAFDGTPHRLALRPGHRDLMHSLNEAGKVIGSGPWADDSGALVVLDVATRAEADEIVAADPYFSAPGVTVVSLREWKPVTVSPKLA